MGEEGRDHPAFENCCCASVSSSFGPPCPMEITLIASAFQAGKQRTAGTFNYAIFDKGAKPLHWRKDSFLQIVPGTLALHVPKTESKPTFHTRH